MALTDPVSLGIATVAAVLAGAIAWVQWPRPPVLDGERWFKVMLATTLRGHMEASDVSAFEEAVLRWVPYHPAGRLPERKVSNPVAASLPDLALEGELALLERLQSIEGSQARLRWMYQEDEVGIEARFADPAELGPSYDPATTLGPGASWDSLASWAGEEDTAFIDAVRRTVDATWVLVQGRPGRGGGPSVMGALAQLLPEVSHTVPFGDGDADALGAALHERASAGESLVVVAEEAGAARLLRALRDQSEVRDRLLAVVSVGGVLMGRADEDGPYGAAACADWMGAHFAQRTLDTDVVRLTPYFSIQWLDPTAWPPGVEGLPLQASRFPEPDTTGATATTMEVVDLGPLPASEEIPLAQVARALIGVVSAWIVHRR